MSDQKLKISRTIHWSIPNVTREFAEEQEVGVMLQSREFNLRFDDNETVWFLGCFLNGNKEESKGNVGLFLRLESATSSNFTAKYKFGIVSETNDISNSKQIKPERNELLKQGLGYPKLISHYALFKKGSNLLPDGKLTLMCELKLFVTKTPALVQPADTLASDLENIFENEFGFDLQLRMKDGETLKASKFVLIARSSVFFKMLTTDMEEAKKNVVNIPDIDSKPMKELLRFAHCNKIQDLGEVDLLIAADKYQMAQLKGICCDQIISDLSLDNVVDVLVLADRMSEVKKMWESCINLVVGNYEELSKTNEWKDMSKDLVCRILDEVMKLQLCSRFDAIRV